MRTNPHARAAIAYLDELCRMLDEQHRIRRPRRAWWSTQVPVAIGLAVSATGCGGSVVDNGGTTPAEVCNDAVDNDGDGKVDCADPDCPACTGPVYAAPDASMPDATTQPEGGDVHPSPEVCDDKSDNDGDGKIDCADPDCSAVCKCTGPENCVGGTDDDCDGLTDCDDPDCLTSACCQMMPAYGAPPHELCNNSIDDDCDGKLDCEDDECQAVQCCINTAYGGPFWGELCYNGKDDDCDGFIDCEDSDCVANACCSMADYAAPIPPPEDCAIPDDEDCDGQIDCADSDCASVCGGDVYAAPQQ